MAKEMIDRLRTTTFSSDPRTFIAAADAIEALQARADNLKQQAKNWAHEARAANSTIEEIYQLCTGATGEPGNWHGAEPVRKLVAERDALVAERDALVAERDALVAERDALAAELSAARAKSLEALRLIDTYMLSSNTMKDARYDRPIAAML